MIGAEKVWLLYIFIDMNHGFANLSGLCKILELVWGVVGPEVISSPF